MENISLFSYFSHLNVLWEAFIEISFTMCQMATTLNTNKIIFDGTITAKLSFIWWKWLFLVLFYKKTHPQFCNKNASLQKNNHINSTGINLKIEFVFWVWNSAVLWKPVNLPSDRHNCLDLRFQISSCYLLYRLQSQWKLSHIRNQKNCEINLKGQILEPLETLQVQIL